MVSGFSVIMPTYNQASFIRRAILSLQRQTYKNWELIIINDGCTDNTEEYLSGLLDAPNIIYIKNDKNQGLGYALNQGLDSAKYDYIAYLPSDDFYYENHLESFKEKIEQYGDIALVYSGMKYASTLSLRKA
jgi:glycosyltransferase involved in cell wall biosynthesis